MGDEGRVKERREKKSKKEKKEKKKKQRDSDDETDEDDTDNENQRKKGDRSKRKSKDDRDKKRDSEFDSIYQGLEEEKWEPYDAPPDCLRMTDMKAEINSRKVSDPAVYNREETYYRWAKLG